MNKKRAVFGLFLIGLFVAMFFSPQISRAQLVDIGQINEYLTLAQAKAEMIMKAVFNALNEEWLDLMSSPYSTSMEQAGLVLVRRATREKVFNYAFFGLPKKATSEVIKAIYSVASFIYSPDQMASLLDKFEKMTVDQAKNYALEWLLQNEIRVATGLMSSSYESCFGHIQDISLPYIITYQPLSPYELSLPGQFSTGQGTVSIAIYSPQKVGAPQSQGDAWSFSLGDIWMPEEKCFLIPPFALHLTGKIEERYGSYYTWLEQPVVQINFNEPTPELDFSEPGLIDKIRNNFEEKIVALEKIVKGIKNLEQGALEEAKQVFNKTKQTTKNVLEIIKSIFVEQENLSGSLVVLPETEQELKKTKVSEVAESTKKSETIETAKETKGTEVISVSESNLSLAQIQEKINDIAQEINILAQQIAALQTKTVKKVAGEAIIATKTAEATGQTKEAGEKKENNEDKQEQGEKEQFCLKNNLTTPIRNKVIFNEIAWMGTDASSNNEWFELKNISNQAVDLSGWQILDKDNQIKIIFQKGNVSKTTIISAQGFFLLERTDDQTIPFKNADFIYTGALSNSNEALYLFNQNCELEDIVLAEPNWPAGDSKEKRTMERDKYFGWETFLGLQSFAVLGTPGAKNSNSTTKYLSQMASQASLNYSSGGASSSDGVFHCSQNDLAVPGHYPVILNEVAWMGTSNSSNDEWIELKNISNELISLDGWQLQNSDLGIAVIFETSDIIEPGQFYLLERTNDNSVSNVTADKIYTGALRNQDETLVLFDKNCQLIDYVLAEPNWPAGDNQTKQTMERGADLTWHSFSGEPNSEIFGTPKQENSQSNQNELEPEQPEEPEKLEYCFLENLNEPTYEPVIINEIAWMGTSASSNDEWIELKNISNELISLENWQLLDKNLDIKIIFESDDYLEPGQFYLLERTDDSSVQGIEADRIYTGALNNTNETLYLFNSQCQLIDKALAEPDWPAGNNQEKRSMERINDLTWQTFLGEDLGQDILGTPKQENSSYQEPELPEPEPWELLGWWDYCQTLEEQDNENVLLTGEQGIIDGFWQKIFVVAVENSPRFSLEKLPFYINANTQLLNQAGEKISDEPGFSFSDYLILGREVKVLYARYSCTLLASKIEIK